MGGEFDAFSMLFVFCVFFWEGDLRFWGILPPGYLEITLDNDDGDDDGDDNWQDEDGDSHDSVINDSNNDN